tara:strand:+ start:8319 stop:9044 length:726 start_codon:yes stop_codon:yes gene_type:complete
MEIKEAIKNLIPARYFYKLLHLRKRFSVGGFKTLSYSGDGEDQLILKYFKGKSNGVYIDIGAFHPKYISNTFLLYKKGWRGINIDASSNAIELFKKYRSEDINLNVGVSDTEEVMTYYNFSHSGVNTFDAKHAQKKSDQVGNKLLGTKEIQCLPLKKILEENFNKLPSQEIDVLDIDVEGLDLQVLTSNDWEKYQPKMILVEDRDFRETPCTSDIYKYLVSKGYTFYAFNNITLVVVKKIT